MKRFLDRFMATKDTRINNDTGHQNIYFYGGPPSGMGDSQGKIWILLHF